MVDNHLLLYIKKPYKIVRQNIDRFNIKIQIRQQEKEEEIIRNNNNKKNNNEAKNERLKNYNLF